ncbi:MAG: formate dehydrogenase subunit gamma [Nevskia sp.]|nr:formate dehydrogenase subunit gamma [Nevskia sp.]
MKGQAREQALHPMPAARPLAAEEQAQVLQVIKRLRQLPGALLPVLHGVQDALGYVPPGAVALIAAELNLTRAEVHGVITFYHYFRSSKPGRQVLRLCRAEACQALGAAQLEQHAKQRLGVDFHGTTADGRYTLEAVYCLGNCACGPSLMLDQELHGRVNAERFDQLLGAAS